MARANPGHDSREQQPDEFQHAFSIADLWRVRGFAAPQLDALATASSRPVHVGSDVFPPSTALAGAQAYDRWTCSATYLTGGFGPRIGWGTVARATVDGFRATAPSGVDPDAVAGLIKRALGQPASVPTTGIGTASAYEQELRLLAGLEDYDDECLDILADALRTT